MGGAKNCPETPRQKMIAMMYLVLTAMLALNVSADILRGFAIVNRGLLTTIESTELRNQYMMNSFRALNDRNPEKVQEWLDKAVKVQNTSNEFFEYIGEFKFEMIRIADGRKMKLADGTEVTSQNIDQYDIRGKDNKEAASNFGLTQGNATKLRERIEAYRTFVIDMFDNDKEKAEDYNKLFSTDNIWSSSLKRNVSWEVANFESMPLAAAVTMLTKLQSDIRHTETELIQFLRSSTDAKDFRVNDINAIVIPDSRTVVAGTTFRAQIMLAARDTTVIPDIVVNGTKVTDRNGWLTLGAGSVGTHKLTGTLSFINPVSNEPMSYPINDEYVVVPPSATVANQDMNVVYMNYANRMSVSVPGFSSDKVNATSPNATMEKTANGLYICRPKSYENVVISVTVNVEGRQVSMGSQTFRVRALPNPTIFLRYTNAAGDRVLFNPVETPNVKPTRANIVGAEVVAEYADGLLQASFSVQSFTLSVSDGRGGFTSTNSDGKNFSGGQKTSLQNLRPGSKVILERVRVTGAKTATLAFPTFDLP